MVRQARGKVLPQSRRRRAPASLTALVAIWLLAGFALQGGCGRSDVDRGEEFYPRWAATGPYNEPLRVRDTDSALGRLNQRPKRLRLEDLARVHGHLCDGLVISWAELRVALNELFPQGVVDRTDLRVVSKNGPCWVDAAAWMTGARVNHGTLVLDNSVEDGFIVQRISTAETVRVQLAPGVFPSELAELERSIRTRRASGEEVTRDEIDRFESLADEFSHTLLKTPPESVVELKRPTDFDFPTESRDPVVSRSDIINRDLKPTEVAR